MCVISCKSFLSAHPTLSDVGAFIHLMCVPILRHITAPQALPGREIIGLAFVFALVLYPLNLRVHRRIHKPLLITKKQPQPTGFLSVSESEQVPVFELYLGLSLTPINWPHSLLFKAFAQPLSHSLASH